MQPHIRISDADRDRVCAILREHHAAGRIGLDELPTRVAAAQAAVNWGDLYGLTRDLPPIPGMPLDPSAYPAAAWSPPYPQPFLAPPAPNPAQGYKTAAWVCFALGFFTCFVTWIPALIFAVLAASVSNGSRPGSAGSARFTTGANIAVVSLTTLVGFGFLVSTLAGLASSDRVEGRAVRVEGRAAVHTVEISVTGNGRATTIGELSATIGFDTSSGTGVPLPYRKVVQLDGPLDQLSVTARARAAEGRRPARLTCVIKVDGEIVARSVSSADTGGECRASFDD